MKVVRTYYRSLLPGGSVWCESSSLSDFREGGMGSVGPVQDGKPMPLTFQRLTVVEIEGPWEEWQP